MNPAATTTNNIEPMMAQDGSSSSASSPAQTSSGCTSPESVTSYQRISQNKMTSSKDKLVDRVSEPLNMDAAPEKRYKQMLEDLGFEVKVWTKIKTDAKPGFAKQCGGMIKNTGEPSHNYAAYAILHARALTDLRTIFNLLSVWYGRYLVDQTIRRALCKGNEFHNVDGKWQIATLAKEAEQAEEKARKAKGKQKEHDSGEEVIKTPNAPKRKAKEKEPDSEDEAEKAAEIANPSKRPRFTGANVQTTLCQTEPTVDEEKVTVAGPSRESTRERKVSQKLKETTQEKEGITASSSGSSSPVLSRQKVVSGMCKKAAKPAHKVKPQVKGNSQDFAASRAESANRGNLAGWQEPTLVESAIDQRPTISEIQTRLYRKGIPKHRFQIEEIPTSVTQHTPGTPIKVDEVVDIDGRPYRVLTVKKGGRGTYQIQRVVLTEGTYRPYLKANGSEATKFRVKTFKEIGWFTFEKFLGPHVDNRWSDVSDWGAVRGQDLLKELKRLAAGADRHPQLTMLSAEDAAILRSAGRNRENLARQNLRHIANTEDFKSIIMSAMFDDCAHAIFQAQKRIPPPSTKTCSNLSPPIPEETASIGEASSSVDTTMVDAPATAEASATPSQTSV